MPVSHIPFEADAAALLEYMAGVADEILLALQCACTVRQPCDPAHFLQRVAAACMAHTAHTACTFRTTGIEARLGLRLLSHYVYI